MPSLGMFAALILILAASPHQVGVVGGWDNRPTATVAEGLGARLAPIKTAAEMCGFSRTWIWDDDTSGAQLWVLASEVQPTRVNCLARWKAKAMTPKVKWVLAGLRPRVGENGGLLLSCAILKAACRQSTHFLPFPATTADAASCQSATDPLAAIRGHRRSALESRRPRTIDLAA